jgi:Zn-dependent M28 family amino/carboxypeptidase
VAVAAAAIASAPLAAEGQRRAAPPAADRDAAIARIIDEGMDHGQVMTTVQALTDTIGPRLTNSPAMRRAEAWTSGKFAEWGLRNIHKEGFAFGRGWSIERSSVRMIQPRAVQLTAIPVAWTPGTGATPLTAPIIVAPMDHERDFAAWRGRLRGRIVLTSQPTPARDADKLAFRRLTGDDIAKLDSFQQPVNDPTAQARELREAAFEAKRDAFLAAEGAVAQATMSYRDGKLVSGEGYLFGASETAKLPAVQIAAEDYRRLARLAKTGPAPVLEIVSDVRFDDSDPQGYNILAEIPGTDPGAGYVMAGAHLDSWVAADGAADNAAGSAMVMEAARILAATGVRPRRTIRFALWSGEEQGLFGSMAYVDRHLAQRGKPGEPLPTGLSAYYTYGQRWPITPRAGYQDLTAYFNIDNGSGKLRGIYAENAGATTVSTLHRWLAPFASMGADAVVASRTDGTDHVFMQQIGVPAFQFVQDPLDYDARIHHSAIDTFDHLKPEDMRQGATVLAGVLLAAADADQVLPHAPLPRQPVVTDPFAYPEDDD